MGIRHGLLLIVAGIAMPAEIRFEEHEIATGLKGGYQVVAADMNRDGRVDLIALASGMPELVWFENPGWTRHVIAGGLARMINVGAHDVDGDGVPELLLAHEFANDARKSAGVVSLLRHSGDPREPWQVREIDRLTTSHRVRWGDFRGTGRKIAINAPLTGASAVPPEYRDAVPVVSYDPSDWKRRSVTSADQGVLHGILVHDWNGDGRDDLLTASFEGIHQHTMDRSGNWTRTRIAAGSPAPWPKSGSSDIAAGRLGRRKFLAAIEPWHGEQVAVYSPNREVIDFGLQDGHTIATADFDGDGRDEIVAGCRGGPQSVFIYREAGRKWTRSSVKQGGIAAAACAVADINGDKRPDLACIGSATGNLLWFENVSSR